MADPSTVELVLSATVIAAAAGLWTRGRYRKRAALRWPVTQGKVLWTTVAYQGGGDPGSSRYVAHVRYTYAVQSETFSGDFKKAFMRRDSADKWAGAYPSGRQLLVRYKAARIGDSILLEEEQAAPAVA
jgi:hypothetical protein